MNNTSLTKEDLAAIEKVVEKCLTKINKIETENKLMNVDEVSERMKLSKQSIYRLIREEQLKSIKIGKNFYVKESDFNNYIKSKY